MTLVGWVLVLFCGLVIDFNLSRLLFSQQVLAGVPYFVLVIDIP